MSDEGGRNLDFDVPVYLISSNGKKIRLKHRESMLIGRSALTGIIDPKVSREHVEVRANYNKRHVRVVQRGSNPSEVNGTLLSRSDGDAILKDKQSMSLLPGRHTFRVHFDSHPSRTKNCERVSPESRKSTSPNLKRPANSKDATAAKRARLSEEQPSSSMESTGPGHEKKDLQDGEKTMQDTVVPSASSFPPDVGSADNVWQQNGTLLQYTSKGVLARGRVAAFDIDNTIICTKSGKVFPTDTGDWRLLYSQIPGALKKLHADGFKVVFFTNQLGIQRGKVRVNDYKEKIGLVVAKLGVPVQVFVATSDIPYRKPGIGMWTYLETQSNDGVKIDMHRSFYIGDAAGRPKDWTAGKKKDFSCADRLFAMNIGLKFETPDEYFLAKKSAPFTLPSFDPRRPKSSDALHDPLSAVLTSSKQEILVFVGFPASGKSFFAKSYLEPKGYVRVNRDSVGSWQKCVALCESSVAKGLSVAVDNTNPDVESRARYIKISKETRIDCRCFVFTTSLEQARHNDKFRKMTDQSHKGVNDMILNSYKSKFSEPKLAEGFTEIVKINFVPKFESKKLEKLYRMFLMEK